MAGFMPIHKYKQLSGKNRGQDAKVRK